MIPAITMTDTLLNMVDVSYTYPGASTPALDGVSFAVSEGECVCLTGHSGCGKTSLLLAIRGLLRGGRLSGRVEISGTTAEGSIPVGIVFQNAESQNFCTIVAEEVAFGPENLCVAPEEIAGRVEAALRDVGFENFQNRTTERFSAGQKQRLAIAAVLSLQPRLLLLDEPTSQLDRQGKTQLKKLLSKLKQQGYTLIMSEHDPRPFAGIIDRCLTMNRGRLTGEYAGVPSFGMPSQTASMGKVANQAVAISVKGLGCSYPETGEVFRDANLDVCKGELVYLLGDNGAGKSTFLRCLSGLEQPDSGTVTLSGVGTPSPELLPGKVGVMFQNPVRQLFADSVYSEVAFSLHRLKYAGQALEQMVEEAMDVCGIKHLADRAPLTLSFGEQHRVALAAIIAPRPGLLLLDEPFAGLDFPQRHALLAVLSDISRKNVTAILMASHDEPLDPYWADRMVLMDGGKLVEAGN